MNRVNILDSSAVLAFLNLEKGNDRVEAALDEGACWISAVNACEILGKLSERGMSPQDAQGTLDDLGASIMDFDLALAQRAAILRVPTRHIGASLGDRACLALAQLAVEKDMACAVYTAEQSWTKLKWPFKIILLR